ncbi:MAG TPA: ATPase domain-containing protein [Thermoplasmata archaeon]|nr:ATPase domain-containing protein [Thermoplasmata archaeon]
MPERSAPTRAADGRVSIGNPQLDEMLEGGLVPHRPYLIVGPSGTGKTTLVLQFLCEGVRRGERSLLVTLEEPPNEVRLNHRNLGPALDGVDVFDAIPDIMRYEHTPFKDIASVRQIVPFAQVDPVIRKTAELNSVEVTIAALEQMLRSEIVRRSYARIAIDSLTALQYFCMKGFDPIGGAQTFLRFVSDLRATTLLTVESPLEDVDTPERMLARGEVRLFRWELDGVTVRAIGVEKFRGSAHDVRLHPYRIGGHGLDVNLGVTISRDTRQILEPVPVVVAVSPGAASPPPALGPLSEEIRDLIALGIDVAPLRGELEAALASVRAGHPMDAVPHLARASSLTIALAESVVAAEPPTGPRSALPPDAYRRLAARAEAVRAGVPPTQLPESGELAQQLDRVLALVPAAAGAPAVPRAELAVPTPSAAPAEPAPVPEATAPVAAPPSEPLPSPIPSEPAPTVAPVPPPPAPQLPQPAPAPTPVATPPVATAEAPAGGKRRRPPTAGVVAPDARRPTTVPPASTAPVVPKARSIPEPPAAPRSHPAASPPPAVAPSDGRAAEPAPGSEGPTAPPAPAPPPLPNTATPELPPVAIAPVPSPPPAAPASDATARRRRKPPATGRRRPEAEGPAAAIPGAEPPTAKPRKRAVRKRKAPPVVTATPEPIAPDDDGAADGAAPPGPSAEGS